MAMARHSNAEFQAAVPTSCQSCAFDENNATCIAESVWPIADHGSDELPIPTRDCRMTVTRNAERYEPAIC
jgi:hypothetical protein